MTATTEHITGEYYSSSDKFLRVDDGDKRTVSFQDANGTEISFSLPAEEAKELADILNY